jgi:ribonuclease E
MERIEGNSNHMPTKLTNEIITAAITGFESQKTHIDTQIAELRAMLSGGPAESAASPEAPTGKRKKFSAAARRRMKEAQQLRWAKIRGESKPAPATPEAQKPKRKLSKAGRAAIVAALKKRWAAKKAAAKKAPVKTVKKTSAKKSLKKTAKAPEGAAAATA